MTKKKSAKKTTQPAAQKKTEPKASEKKTKAPAMKASADSSKKAPALSAASTAAPVPDQRLPAPGTVIQKKDRHGRVRCECTVEKDGIRFKGKIYSSLSAAAVAAAKDLGLAGKAMNGFVFWGLTKPPRPGADPVATLERAWERYRGVAESVADDGVSEEKRGKVKALIAKHAQALTGLREKVA
jgi:hypothetical protein